MIKRKDAYSTVELVTLILIIAAAVLVMNSYVRRAIMGRLKESADGLGSQFSVTTVSKNGLHTITSHSEINYILTVNGTTGEEFKNFTRYYQNQVENMTLGNLDNEEDLL